MGLTKKSGPPPPLGTSRPCTQHNGVWSGIPDPALQFKPQLMSQSAQWLAAVQHSLGKEILHCVFECVASVFFPMENVKSNHN